MSKHYCFLFFVGLLMSGVAGAQNIPGGGTLPAAVSVRQAPAAYTSAPVNYMRSFSPQVPIADTSLINMSSLVEDVQTGVVYADSYGRTVESVSKQLSPGKKDNVSAMYYDDFGRGGSYSYLPFAAVSGTTDDGLFKSNPFQQDSAFYKTHFAGESVNYSQTLYDGSPLNMPVKTMSPGNERAGANIGVVMGHRSSKATDSVRYWTIDISSEDDLPATSSYYAAGSLMVEEITDEGGVKSITYKDIAGRTVLTKAQIATTPAAGMSGWLCTYYVYDEMGRLRAIIPPKATEAFVAVSWNVSGNQAIYTGLCYSYFYDGRGRQIMKLVPGKGKSYVAYDLLNRPVMTQDPNLRNTGQWAFILYDEQGRGVKGGVMTTSLSKDSVWAQAARSTAYPSLSGTYSVMSETYYDDYDWIAASGAPVSGSLNTNYINSTNFITTYNSSPDYAQEIATGMRIRGAVTGKKTLVLGDTSHLYSVVFYDKNARAIQSQQTNISGGTDIATTQTDYKGAVLRSHLLHSKGGTNAQTHTVLTKYSYDHAGRMLTIKKSVDSTADKTIATNTYAETGQVASKTLGSTGETQNYSYDIRGSFTGINNSFVTTPGSTASYFGESIFYSYGFTNNLNNGGIAGTKWKSRGDGIARAYGYTYDKVNRLMSGDYSQQNEGSSAWTKDQADFSVSGLSYDAGGNIMTMKQRGLLGAGGNATIDSLSYTYFTNTNRLQKVADGATSYGLGDFKDSTNTGDDYSYDANGNTVKDLNRKMHVSGGAGAVFNMLDKPDSMAVAGKSCTYYTYDASGVMLKKRIKNYVTNTTNIYSYVSGFVYFNDTLQYDFIEEGRVRIKRVSSTTEVLYDYFVKDHAGNVRAMLTEEARTDMYPAATMETADTAQQSLYYNNISNTYTAKPSGYPASSAFTGGETETTNNYVARLKAASGSQQIGPSVVLKVMAGDTFNIAVNSWYKTNSVTPGTPVNPLNAIVGALINNISGTAVLNTHGVSSGDLTTSGSFTPDVTNFLNNQTTNTNTARPKAYLNWVLFDEQFKIVSSNSGFEQVGNDQEAKRIVKTNMPVAKCGYLYVYVSNETPNIDVYFDELQVSHKRGPLMETNEYYPYGLQMKHISYRSAGTLQNKYKSNGGNELEEESELNYHETFYRKYDAQIGRFTGIDMLAEQFAGINPYQFGANNPVTFNDPMGDKFGGANGERLRSMSPQMNDAEYDDYFSGGGLGGGGGSSGTGESEHGNYSGFWNFAFTQLLETAGNTNIQVNIPGFGNSYFGIDLTNMQWGFYLLGTVLNPYNGPNNQVNVLSALLADFATSSNALISGRFTKMLAGNIVNNIILNTAGLGNLAGIVTDALGNVISTNTAFSTQANNAVPENDIPRNGTSDFRAQFAAEFLSSTFINSTIRTLTPSNQVANGYYQNGQITWLQGNQDSQRPTYGTNNQFAQSSKNAADRVYVENVTLSRYRLQQRSFYVGLFMSARGAQLEQVRLGTMGGVRAFSGIFMFDNNHF